MADGGTLNHLPPLALTFVLLINEAPAIGRQHLPARKSLNVLVVDKSYSALALTYAGGRVAGGRVRLDVARVYWHLCQRGAVAWRDGEVSKRQQHAGLHSGARVALLNLAVQLQFRGVSIGLGIVWEGERRRSERQTATPCRR